MPVTADLIKLLACPKCKGPVEADGKNGIICQACALRFPVRDDIPVMLIDESEDLESN